MSYQVAKIEDTVDFNGARIVCYSSNLSEGCGVDIHVVDEPPFRDRLIRVERTGGFYLAIKCPICNSEILLCSPHGAFSNIRFPHKVRKWRFFGPHIIKYTENPNYRKV